MENWLKEINVVHGVIGSFICRNDGSVAAWATSESLSETQIDTAARIASQTFNALEASGQRVWEADLVFGQSRLMLKNLMTGVLVIVCQRNINLPLLNSTANVVAQKIAAELKPAKPEIAPAPASASLGEPGSLLADLEQEHKHLTESAKNSEIALCAIDPIPVWIYCKQTRRLLVPPERRRLIFVAASKQKVWIARFFERAGYTANQRFNELYGDRHLNYYNPTTDFNVEVYLNAVEMYLKLDLTPIVSRNEMILPLTALALVRLQMVEITDAQLSDLTALLLEYDLSIGPDQNRLDASEITHLCADDWSWGKAVTMNLDRVVAFASTHLPANEQAIVTERARRLRQSIDHAPKSLRWQTRARLGEGVRWHETPVMVTRPSHGDFSFR